MEQTEYRKPALEELELTLFQSQDGPTDPVSGDNTTDINEPGF